MRNFIRSSRFVVVLAMAAAACSRSSEPKLSDDLKQDLAKVGGGDVQLAGASSPKLDVVSASERTMSPAPAPKAPQVSRTASTHRGSAAPVRSPKAEQPVAVESRSEAADAAPVQAPSPDVVPQPSLPAAGRPQAPLPSTQREPRGGWRTPGEIIRNAPFPINP